MSCIAEGNAGNQFDCKPTDRENMREQTLTTEVLAVI